MKERQKKDTLLRFEATALRFKAVGSICVNILQSGVLMLRMVIPYETNIHVHEYLVFNIVFLL
jgi:hypothetical protein